MAVRISHNEENGMWYPAFTLCLVAIGAGICALIGLHLRGPLMVRHNFIMPCLSLLGLFILLITRKKKSENYANTIFLLVVASAVLTVWLNHDFFIRSGKPFSPFAGTKIVSILLGLMAAPNFRINVAAFGLLGISTLVQYFSWTTELREVVSVQEPWLTQIVILVSVGVYVIRIRSIRLERERAKLEEKAALLQRFAHILINAQNLANTPLQTIGLSTQMIKAKHPETVPAFKPVDRALEKVREVVKLFSTFDSFVEWEDLELPNSIEGLRKQADELLEGGKSSVLKK